MKILSKNGKPIAFNGMIISPPEKSQAKTVDLSMASGNQVIAPDDGYSLSEVTVTKPATLIPENIKKDVDIGGVVGTMEGGGGGGGGATVTVENGIAPGYTNTLNFNYWKFGLKPGDNSTMTKIEVAKGETITVRNVLAISDTSTSPDATTGMLTGAYAYWIPYTDSASFYANPQCLTGDTLITLSDGTSKRIDLMNVGDKILSYDPHTHCLVDDVVTYTDSAEYKQHTEYDVWHFSAGFNLKTVHRHRFYNVEHQAMLYMDEWKIGDHGITIDGNHIELLSHENIRESVRHYTIFTRNQNYFANGVLSGNRYTPPMKLQ